MDWEREYVAQQSQNKHQQRLTLGDLLRHDGDVSPFGNPLDQWLAQVDDFGTLVMAAASLFDNGEYHTS